jgi:PilZ domain
MLQRSFGKLGKRANGRLAAGLDALLVLPGKSIRCTLDNISRRGAKLTMELPPVTDTTAILRVDRIEAFGTIIWVRGQRCGLLFEDPVAVSQLERIRWATEHLADHQRSKMNSAGAVWR